MDSGKIVCLPSYTFPAVITPSNEISSIPLSLYEAEANVNGFEFEVISKVASMKLKISGGDIKAVQGDTGHAQANMVTDVYGHIMNDDRRRLAQAVDRQFFAQAPIIEAPKKEETTAQSPIDESTKEAMQLLQNSPEMAKTLLQMAKLFGDNNS